MTLPSPPPHNNNETLTRLVTRVFRIDDTTWGAAKQGFLVRYGGELYGDSEAAYDQLSNELRHYEITPIFRKEKGKHTIYLKQGINLATPSNPWVNFGLFILTLLSVLFAGALYNYDGPVSENFGTDIMNILANLSNGWPFAVSMLGILLAHEFGHYLAARYHKTAVTLPYFIPFPLSPFGTMGAFIQLKEPPKNKNILLDIGAAGPLAGLIVAVPVLLIGLYTSEVHQLPQILPLGQGFEGNSLLYLALKYIIHGKILPEPASYGSLNPMLYWIRYFFTGMPLPHGGIDVMLNSVAWAGWAGLLVTALNLIPVGQLDGGHNIYVLLGQRARKLVPFIIVILLLLGLVWSGWWLWAVLILIFGRTHAQPLDQITPLSPRRKAVALLGLIIFILVFTPVPLVSPPGV
ncbi:MAG: site-2 protease family protein [Chloroflexota bacterium]|nr:site-2 protease family protein [Chloroflexota bacterium]